MKTILLQSTFFLLCISSIVSVSVAEPAAKPTREQIIEFLKKYKNNHPLSEEEKQVEREKREKIDLVKRFGTDFTGLDLSGIDFRETDRGVFATGIDFSNCNLRETVFAWSIDLTGCNFTSADLTSTKFWFCELENANFSQAKLDKTDFGYCNMRNVLFVDLDARTSEFAAVNFAEAKLMNTNFSGAKFQHPNVFTKSDLTGANFSAAELDYACLIFLGANLTHAHFRNTDLRRTDFTGAHLEDTDFTGANLDAAIFAGVTGIGDVQRQALEKRAARWWYDLKMGISDFLTVSFYWGYPLILIVAVVSSLAGLFKRDEKSGRMMIPGTHPRSFVIAFFLNGFAVFSTFCTLLMMFSGGHPVRQMSQGNYDAWSFWLHFFQIPFLGLLFCIVCSFVLMLIVFAALFRRTRGERPWRLFFYLVLTFVHCLFAFNWLIMFMPDA